MAQPGGVLDADAVARLAGTLADRTRSAMCLALLDGRAWTVGELARHAGVARSTASEHVTLLVAAEVLAEERQGRHRYVRIASPEVAQVIEDLAAVVAVPEPVRSLRAARSVAQLAGARTCYDHLAGRLGVALLDSLLARQLISQYDGLALTRAGREWMSRFLADVPSAGAARRPLLRTCLDWTERRPHLGGALGAALHRELLGRGWTQLGTPPRTVVVTPAGRVGLHGLLGLQLDGGESVVSE